MHKGSSTCFAPIVSHLCLKRAFAYVSQKSVSLLLRDCDWLDDAVSSYCGTVIGWTMRYLPIRAVGASSDIKALNLAGNRMGGSGTL
jgi:hypothetical protein